MGDHRRIGVAVLVGAVVMLSACSSVVDGTGATVAAPSPRTSTSASPKPGTNAFPRTPTQSALGDPVTADLCAAIGLPAMRISGYSPEFIDVVYPPSCAVRMFKNSVRQFTVNVYADYANRVTKAAGRTSADRSGLNVYLFPYGAKTGDCERDIAVQGATLKINVVPNRDGGTATATDTCRGSDAMATRLAQQAAIGPAAFPRLPLATPSLSRFDLCALVRTVDLTTFPVLDGPSVSDIGFTTDCSLNKNDTFVEFALGTAGPPPQTHLKTVGGHKLYVDDDISTFCNWYSVQGTTSDGKSERIVVTTDSGSSSPATACPQAGQLLAAVLDKADLS